MSARSTRPGAAWWGLGKDPWVQTSPRDDLARWGHWALSGDIRLSQVGAVSGIQGVQAGDAAQHPARHGTAPKTQVPTGPRLRTSGTDQVAALTAQCKINH